jgi:hypothetical protein
MLRTTSVLALAVAAVGFAAPAMAVSGSAGVVNVNIEVHQIVSAWPNDANIFLELNGANMENSDAVASSFGIINNVDAHIDATVNGSLPDDQLDWQDPPQPANAVNFHIFNGGTEATAIAAIAANANNPAGAKTWTNDTLGTTQTVIPSTGIHLNVESLPVVYAAGAPNVLPMPDDWDLTVTYTITSN